MLRKIIEISIDLDTLKEKHAIVVAEADLPFTSKEQQVEFNKQMSELVVKATDIVKAAKGNCQCDDCKARRSQQEGGSCENVHKPRYRTY